MFNSSPGQHPLSDQIELPSDIEDESFEGAHGEESDGQSEDLDNVQMQSEVLDLQSISKSHSTTNRLDWIKTTMERTREILKFASAHSSGTSIAQAPSPNANASASTGRPPPLAEPHMPPLVVRSWAPIPEPRLNSVSTQGGSTQIQSISDPQWLSRSLPSSVPGPQSLVPNKLLQVPLRPSIPCNPIICNVPLAPSQNVVTCLVCAKEHPPGHCPLRNAEIQQCPACGYSHLHRKRTCPLLQDLEHVEAMYRRLNESTESREIVRSAKHYLSGVKASLATRKTDGRKN